MAKDIAVIFAIAGAVALFVIGIISFGFGVGLAIKGGMRYRRNARENRIHSEAAKRLVISDTPMEMTRLSGNDAPGKYVTLEQIRAKKTALTKDIGYINYDIKVVIKRIQDNHVTLSKYSDNVNTLTEQMKTSNTIRLSQQHKTSIDKYDKLVVDTNTLLKHREEYGVEVNEKIAKLEKIEAVLYTLKSYTKPIFMHGFE